MKPFFASLTNTQRLPHELK